MEFCVGLHRGLCVCLCVACVCGPFQMELTCVSFHSVHFLRSHVCCVTCRCVGNVRVRVCPCVALRACLRVSNWSICISRQPRVQ